MVAGQLIPLPQWRRRVDHLGAGSGAPAVAHQRPAPPRRPVRRTGISGLEPLQRQIACRAINEHIREISQHFACGEQVEFVCECARPGCFETVPLSPRLYEEIRQLGNRFFVIPGHSEDEKQTTPNERIVIVEKTGTDAAEAIRANPRRSHPRRSRFTPEAA
jgi:hypothetical protein